MAGDTIEAAQSSQLMIHEASGLAVGTAQDLESVATVLRKINAAIGDIFSQRTGLPANEIARMLAEETWLDAEEAVGLGFVDRVLERGAAPAPRAAVSAAPRSKRELEELLRKSGVSRSAANRAAAAAFICAKCPDDEQLTPSRKEPSRRYVSTKFFSLNSFTHASTTAAS